MEINNLNLGMLHNEEHFQHQKEFKEQIEKEGAKKLDIEKDFTEYLVLYAQEEEALNQIRKSATTGQIELADLDRDKIVDGFTDSVNSLLKHFDEGKRKAASRICILLDQYGDIARKPYDDETAAIHKLVQELTGPYAPDVQTAGLVEWIPQLDSKNKAFEFLQNERHSEKANKSRLRMKSVRIDIDNVYKNIIKRINALMLINGTTNHEAFARELNARIEKLNNSLAMRKGRSKKNGEQTKTEIKTENAVIMEKK